MTLDNIAYEILELVRPNRTDDSEISLTFVKDRVNDLRALYLRQELGKVTSIEHSYIQDLGCVALESVDPIECDNVSGDNFILRTTVDIPTPIELKDKLLFTRIGPVDKTKPNFNYYNYEQTYYSEYKRFGKKEINTFYRNNRIYIYANECVDFIKLMDNINIQGVFDNPSDISSNACFEANDEYPISRWMKENIIQQIVRELTNKLSQPQDNLNNASDQ